MKYVAVAFAPVMLWLPACVAAPPSALAAETGPGIGAGWQAFCASRGGTAADCDAIPATTAMPDGRPTIAPPAWWDYCRRNRGDSACAG